MATTRIRDEHGNPFSGSAEARDLYDRAVDRLLRYHVDVVPLATQLATEHADAPMAHALFAYLHLTSTDRPDVAPARATWTTMGDLAMSDREVAHHRAIGAWLDGDWRGAADTLDTLLRRWPSDVLALQVGHQLDFFVGDAVNLRDRPGRSMLALDPQHPHTAFVHGMHAFGLEEAGHYDLSEAAGLGALEVNPDDVWAVHAVVHTYEMEGRVDEGIRFLVDRHDDWADGNLFTVHNWWHLALYLLEAGDVDGALRIYDTRVHHADSDGVPLEMLDASALLWRLLLDDHDTGTRFAVLADAWATRADADPWYVFNDLHVVMAMVGADRVADAEAHVERLERWRASDPVGTNLMMTTDVGLPACRAVVSFAKGGYGDTVDELAPRRRHFHRFGGSHAQRDALERTLLEAALRDGQLDLARALLSERLSVRSTSVYGWSQQARLDRARADGVGEAAAAARADEARARFARAEPQAGISTITS